MREHPCSARHGGHFTTAHQQETHEGDYPCMLPPGDSRRGLNVVYSVLYQPMKHLHGQGTAEIADKRSAAQ